MAADLRRARDGSRLLAAAALAAAIVALVVSPAPAATSKTVVITDARDDASGALDLRRASLQRASDGRLRAALSFSGKLTPKSLLAPSGPPGSACLRIWTARDADPAATRPDRLVCVTARSDDELRGGVYSGTGAGFPVRVAGASVTLTASRRSIVVRFAQSSIGRPQRFAFAVESTRPGCSRAACIDTAPARGAARSFRLR